MEKQLASLLALLPQAEVIGSADKVITDVTADSRAVVAGSLFICLKGATVDGHKFLTMAAEKGAVAALVEDVPTEVPQGVTLIKVADTREAMEMVTPYFYDYPGRKLRMIGVTGTNGKTTSTNIIRLILRKAGYKVGLIGTINIMINDEITESHNTTPDVVDLQKTLYAMCCAGCDYCVMEVSSHALALKRVAGIEYDCAVLTNITQDHLDFHKTMEAYAEAKALLFAQSDVGIVNADDEWAHVMIERAKCPMHTYSAKRNDADLVAKDIRLSASGVRFVAMHGDAIARMRLGIPGMFSVYNALSVIACACALGISLDDCSAALDTAKPVKGRAEVLETDGDYTILIDYAVTPDAIDNILTTVREFAPARLVFLFGCGGDRDRGKRPKMGRIAGQKADFVIVTSDNPRTEDPEAIIADILPGLKETRTPYVVRPDRREAIAYAIENHCPGDVIILCGKGHEDYQIIGKTKVHMDEREIVAEILEKRKREK